ncbi:MAG: hypothetical protein VKN83_03750 [Cyanobacteriota bacterium]|nr:hypothetical protein [Cyanobacteriota bacterium]
MADSMPEPQRPSAASAGAPILTSTLLGALAGAGGLAWWLWRQSQRRKLAERERRLLRLSRFQGGVATEEPGLLEDTGKADALPVRVQQLNQAIEEVRRQLEALEAQS